MELDDIRITRAIIENYKKKLLENLETDVAIVGAGPSALVAAYYLARAGKKVAIFERKLAPGGGMWGGGMMFNEIVVQEEAKAILDEFGIRSREVEKGYYTADSVEAVSGLCFKALKAGATLFNLVTAVDVMFQKDRVTGLVINWTPVDLAKLHVDPLTVRSGFVVDASGHPSEIARLLQDKMGVKLNTETGKIMGEKSMWAEAGEEMVMHNTREIYPGAYVIGMAANAVYGSPRMGPVFGGMLLSGKKLADILVGADVVK
jgi:thiazole biosynthesis enzyme